MTLFNKRFTWEDALVDAQTEGVISNGALLVAVKLAKAINWAPTDPARRRQAGLYWKNDDAFKAVGVGRSTYYRHARELREAGFIKSVGNNLHPSLPDGVQPGTDESNIETLSSQLETVESLDDQSCSEDKCSEDLVSEDQSSESASASLLHRNDLLTSQVKPSIENWSEVDDQDVW